MQQYQSRIASMPSFHHQHGGENGFTITQGEFTTINFTLIGKLSPVCAAFCMEAAYNLFL